MTTDRPKRERLGPVQQWRSYASLPTLERRTHRAGMIAGALVGAATLVLLGRGLVWVFITVWRATSWS